MQYSVLVFLVCIAFAGAALFNDIVKEEWQTFKSKHHKHYSNAVEERFRLKVFNENRLKIARHNQLHAAGKKSFKMAANKYTDMLHHELKQIMNGYNNTQRILQRSKTRTEWSGATFLSPAHLFAPKSVDWRIIGAVTAIKDQGHCSSCWAFSSTGALEGQHFRKSGVLLSLSEQNLIDCSVKYGNNGCNDGFMDNAFRYIKENGGINTEKSYPYEGIGDSCRFNPAFIGATNRGVVHIPEGDEKKMMQAVASVGPISVAIDAAHESFHFYSEGVYDEPECSAEQLDHGVLVVGYGTDSNGLDYWLVKNSWGSTWGDHGYIKMARNKQNQCGIATASSYPLV